MPAPNRSRIARRARVVGSAVAVCAALLSGCGGAAAPDDSEARAVVDQFLQQIRAGDVDAAWESTTADFKSDEGRESFRKFVKQRPVLSKPLEITDLKQVDVHGLTRWEAVLHPPPDAKSAPATIRTMIAPEADVWKVDRLIVE